MVTSDFLKGKYRVRLTNAASDIRAAQRLRYRAFIDPEAPVAGSELDADRFDRECLHVLIEDRKSQALAGCYRLLPLEDGCQITQSYSAQFYDLSALSHYPGAMVEMGRFCMAPGVRDPDILRVAWAMMTRFVDDQGIEMMFGCSSFAGTDPAPYLDAFALLRQRHMAPRCWLPGEKVANVFRFAELATATPDIRRAQRIIPPLLRTYLLMGGWVSDHAVIDRDLNTLHVFTGLEVSAVPAARARILRATAAT